MRQVWISAPDNVEVRSAEPPSPGPGEVRVTTTRVGVCGSDVHALHGLHPFIDLPVSPGHEAVGTVSAVGDGVDDLAVGDRVLLEPNVVCGQCWYCRSGRYNLCEHLRVVGCQMDGAMADEFVAPAGRFHRVPDGLSTRAAAMVEPMSTGTHAARVAGGLEGAAVAVLGAGAIGLVTMLAARAAGAAAIAVTDPLAAKRQRALDLGADLAVAPDGEAVAEIRGSLPHRPDVVFDCVANQATTDQALELAQKGGTVVVVGVPTGPVTVEWPLVQDRELRIQGTAMYTRPDVERAIELAGTVAGVEQLVTAEFSLEEAPAAFAAAATGEQVKVHVVADGG